MISGKMRFSGSPLTFSADFTAGELVPGTRYRVVVLLGAGGMGTVYEVEHVELGKRFVLKCLLPELARRGDLVQRLRLEWQSLARLEHRNIVGVTDAGTTAGGVPFFVMERLDGETLADRLSRSSRFQWSDALSIAAQVLEGLSAAHEIRIFHRDIKPANIFLTASGGVKLLDFGIAKIADFRGMALTAGGVAVGTPRYMSPEQARGEAVDARSDIYSVGLMLFEMLAGESPFGELAESNEYLVAHLTRKAPVLSALLADIPEELSALVSAMLAKNPAERPASSRALADILRGIAARCSKVNGLGHATTVPELSIAHASAPVRVGSEFAAPVIYPGSDGRNNGEADHGTVPGVSTSTERLTPDVPSKAFPLALARPLRQNRAQTPESNDFETRTRLPLAVKPARQSWTPPPAEPLSAEVPASPPRNILSWVVGFAGLGIGVGFLGWMWWLRGEVQPAAPPAASFAGVPAQGSIAAGATSVQGAGGVLSGTDERNAGSQPSAAADAPKIASGGRDSEPDESAEDPSRKPRTAASTRAEASENEGKGSNRDLGAGKPTGSTGKSKKRKRAVREAESAPIMADPTRALGPWPPSMSSSTDPAPREQEPERDGAEPLPESGL